ncbi:hypothetical protein G9A89_020697 [Geosiphon pyriformis]|nr:hypothetical protein G9A89_020697 [Geosiphon pyriformis]
MTIETKSLRSNHDYILGTAFALRLLLFQFPEITDTLSSRVEIVTPVTSFTRRMCGIPPFSHKVLERPQTLFTPVSCSYIVTEGLYLFQNSVPPYNGGVFHQAPLFLAVFQPLTYLPDFLIYLTYIGIDLLIAYVLSGITRIKQDFYKNLPRLDIELVDGNRPNEIDPWVVAGLYLFNPFTIATCLSRSTIVFTNLAIVLGTYYSLRGNKSYGCFWMAMAAYLSFYPLMLIIPTILLLTNTNREHSKIKNVIIQCVLLYIGWLGGLLTLSYLLVGSWKFLEVTYGVILLLTDLTPNIGLFWYFFIEMFDQFRSFFLVVFQLHTFIFAAPVALKFRDHPLFVIFLLCGIMAIFKSYPSIGDTSLYLAFLPIYSEIVKYMRYNFLTTNIFLYSSILAPIFYHLWIYAGSGNANFFYAITLVYSIGNIILLVDATYAMLRREFDIWNPQWKGCEVTQK